MGGCVRLKQKKSRQILQYIENLFKTVKFVGLGPFSELDGRFCDGLKSSGIHFEKPTQHILVGVDVYLQELQKFVWASY